MVTLITITRQQHAAALTEADFYLRERPAYRESGCARVCTGEKCGNKLSIRKGWVMRYTEVSTIATITWINITYHVFVPEPHLRNPHDLSPVAARTKSSVMCRGRESD